MEGGAEGGGVSVCPKAETDSGSAEASLEKKKNYKLPMNQNSSLTPRLNIVYEFRFLRRPNWTDEWPVANWLLVWLPSLLLLAC